jgi:nucleoside-diphosphate-sugar epimerase
MKILLTGGTGVAGRPALAQLAAAGHDVTVASRGKDELVRALGGTPVAVDVFDAAAVKDAVAGHDAVVNLLTSIPPLSKAARPKAWAMNDRLRAEASGNLVDGALAAGIGLFVQESIAFIAQSSDGWVDEASPVDFGTNAAVGIAEANAGRVTEAGGRGIVLRFAQFYGADTAHTVAQAKLIRRRISPFMGPKDAYWTHVHVDDVASAVVAALDAPAGLYCVAEDAPATRGALAAACAAALGVKPPRAVPPGLVGAVSSTSELLMRNLRIRHDRFTEATGWRPAHPDPLVSIPQVFAEAVRS